MADSRRHDRNQTRSGDLSFAINGHLEFAFDYLIDLFLRMEVLVNRRTAGKVVVCERHALRLEISSMPTRQSLNHGKAVCIQKRHGAPRSKYSHTPGLTIKTEFEDNTRIELESKRAV